MPDKTHSVAANLLVFSRELVTSLSRTAKDPELMASVRKELNLPPPSHPMDQQAVNDKFVAIDRSLQEQESRPAEDLTFDESIGELLAGGKKIAELVELMFHGKDGNDPRTYGDIAYALATMFGSEWFLRRRSPIAFAIVRALMYGYERVEDVPRFDPFHIFDNINSSKPFTRAPGFGTAETIGGLVVPTMLIVLGELLSQLSDEDRIHELRLKKGAKYLAGKLRFKLGWDPSPNVAPEVQSLLARALTLEFGGKLKLVDMPTEYELSLLLTALMLEAEDGGPGFLFHIGGKGEFKIELQTQKDGAIKQELECKLNGPGGAQFLWNTDTREFGFVGAVDPDPLFEIAAGVRGTEAVPAGRVGKANKSRFDIVGIKSGFSLGRHGLVSFIEFKNAELVLDLAEVLPDPAGKVFRDAGAGLIRGRVDGKLNLVPRAGLSFEGEAGLKIRLASNGVNAGDLRFDYLDLELGIGAGGAVELSLMMAVHFRLGPFAASVDRMGFAMGWGQSGGQVSEKLRPLPPKGIGLSLKTAVFEGGGFLYLDAEKGEYAGAFEARAFGGRGPGVQVIVILTTKVPNDAAPFALFTAGYVRVPGGLIELPLGFKIFGFGLLLGLHHGFDRLALESALASGAMDDVIFPKDVAADAPRIINSLRTIFPIQEHALTIGVMVELGWGHSHLCTLRLGLIVPFVNALGGATLRVDYLILLGRIAVICFESVPLRIQLIADLVGEIRWKPEFRALAIGQLRDSRLGLIGVDGTIATLTVGGDNPNFVLSAGGFHPEFKHIPAHFPTSLKRLAVTYDIGIIKAWVRAYFAVTPATLQFGAELGIRYIFGPLSFGAEFKINALIKLPPDFSFVADASGYADLKFRGHELFGVGIQLRLEGPDKWRAQGRGTFTILFWDEDIDFDESWGTDSTVSIGRVKLAEQVQADLDNSTYWRLEIPNGAHSYVTLAPAAQTQNSAVPLTHPLAEISYIQPRVPFGLELQRYGYSPIDGPTLFPVPTLTNDSGQPFGAPTVLTEHFSVAHYRDIPETERLAQPGFQRMPAGIASGGGGYVVPAGPHSTSTLEYEEIFRDEAGGGIVNEWSLGVETLTVLAASESAGRSELRWQSRIAARFPPVKVLAAPLSAVADARTLTPAAVLNVPAWAQGAPVALAMLQPFGLQSLIVEDFELSS